MAVAEKLPPLRETVEITVPPSVRARVSASGASLTANLALARALETKHRVAHRILVRKEKALPVPRLLSPEEKLLGAIFGEKAAEADPQLEVVKAGEPVRKWGLLVKTIADGEVRFTSAAQGEVEKVEHLTAGLPKGFAQQIEVVVRWTSPLSVGDELLAGKKSLGVITAIVEDGASEPVLTLESATVDSLLVTRALPTALQRMSARSIGPYSLVTQRPVTGEFVTDQELSWLANRGYLALFGDFAAYKGDPPERRIRVYETLVKGEPITDPWSEWHEGQLEKQRLANPVPAPAPAPASSKPEASGMRDIFSFFEKPGRGDGPPTLQFGYADSLARVAGVSLTLQGHSILARPALPADSNHSHGRVTKPETLNYRTLLPEAGGLFCQKIFGPVKDYECACGKLSRIKNRGMVCETCGVECIRSRVRRERLGHIELPSPVVPFHLRPLLGALLDADPAVAVASLAADGGQDLSARLAAIDPVWRSASLLAGDPRRALLDAFAASGLAAKDLLWHRIPVLPPDLRPLVPLDGGRFATSDLNDLYRRVINRANRLFRLLELGAPEVIIVNERAELQKAVDQLLFNGSLGKAVPRVSFQSRVLAAVVPTLLSVLRGDRKFRTDYSGRAVAVVDPGLAAVMVVPQEMLFEIARPILYGLAEKAGYVTTIKSAKKLVEENLEIRRGLVEEAYRERPMLLAGGNGSLGAAFVRSGDDPVIRVGAELAGQLGIVTGVEACVHLPISDPALEEARRLAGGAMSSVNPVSGSSWIVELPRSALAAAERMIEVAFEKVPDDAMHPSVGLLVGGYEMPKH